MTPQRQRRLGRIVRTAIISLGLTALTALSYHSATAPSHGSFSEDSLHHAAVLTGVPQKAPAPTARPTSPTPLAPSPSLPAPASSAIARPGPEDPEDPANREQTSLQDAANRDHTTVRPGQPEPPKTPGPAPRGPVLPSDVFKRGAANLGGCLEAYGENGQCVPVVPPSLAQHLQEMKKAGHDAASMKHRWSCRELREYFQDGVEVRRVGIDPQNLDSNGDGRACGAGDSAPR